MILTDPPSGRAGNPRRAAKVYIGEEIFFEIPVRHPQELGQETVQAGDLGYWPPGRAFCVFFGPTPASRGDEIRPASPVTVIGHLRGDPKAFRHVRDGARVVLARREESREVE
ncbi:MAG: hypothetical protein E6G99_08595 [Bacillati bacterium ANGP1]|uniref:Cyclophilin TM1367-like domain-containing protein n=1 Tax=Candidatus Segetimicrobium genomatis TaxID=2569760 RepID=A0A537LFJ9_9BACT|nr:MAG: hypothetical protein E6G99_08595 [Terrabacteria group bacterium ANGP1]